MTTTRDKFIALEQQVLDGFEFAHVANEEGWDHRAFIARGLVDDLSIAAAAALDEMLPRGTRASHRTRAVHAYVQLVNLDRDVQRDGDQWPRTIERMLDSLRDLTDQGSLLAVLRFDREDA